MSNLTDNVILNAIAKEIEQKHNCEVLDISFAQILSLCVRYKVRFKDDFLFRPFENLPDPDTICFSDRTATFLRRVDLFDCVKNQTIKN